MDQTHQTDLVDVNGRSIPRARYLVILTGIGFIAYALVSMDATMIGVALPVIAKSTGWSLAALGFAVSLSFVPIVLAGLISGPVADRLGRKRTVQYILLIVGLFSGLTAVVSALWQFTVVRFLAGAGLAEGPIANTLVAEEAPPKRRGTMIGMTQAGYPIGLALAGLLGSLILPRYGWRPLFLFAFLPILVILLVMRFLREPPVFSKAHDTPKKSVEWVRLFSERDRKQTITLTVFSILEFIGIPLTGLLTVTYLVTAKHVPVGEAALLFSLMNWVALVAQIGTGFLSNYVPAKLIIAIWCLLGGVGLGLAAFGGNVGWAYIGLIGYALFGNGLWGCYPRYISESYSTDVRATAMSFFVALGNTAFLWLPAVGGALLALGRGSMLFAGTGVLMIIASLAFAILARHIGVKEGVIDQEKTSLMV